MTETINVRSPWFTDRSLGSYGYSPCQIILNKRNWDNKIIIDMDDLLSTSHGRGLHRLYTEERRSSPSCISFSCFYRSFWPLVPAFGLSLRSIIDWWSLGNAWLVAGRVTRTVILSLIIFTRCFRYSCHSRSLRSRTVRWGKRREWGREWQGSREDGEWQEPTTFTHHHYRKHYTERWETTTCPEWIMLTVCFFH